MAKPKITLYLDIISPFGYLAFHILRNTPVFQQCTITYVPMFLGGIMQATGNTPPINVKNKDKWINLERTRWAEYFKIPIAAESPTPFPQSTINTQRALCAVAQLQPSKLEAAFEALYGAFWMERKTIGKPEVIAEALEPVLGKEETGKILAATKSEEVKALLKSNTDQAFKDGCFGLPWFVCTNSKGQTEGFWGIDHLGQVMEFLGLERPNTSGFKAVL